MKVRLLICAALWAPLVTDADPGTTAAGSGHGVSETAPASRDERVALQRKSLQITPPVPIKMGSLRQVLSDKFRKTEITSDVLEALKKVQRGGSEKIDSALKRLDPEEGRLLYQDRDLIRALGLDYRDVVYIESRYQKLHKDDGLYLPGNALEQEALRELRTKTVLPER